MSRDTRYFIKAVEEHGVVAAASKLNVAPSTISRSIMALEKKFKTTLFKRNSKPLNLTTDGNTVYNYLKQSDYLESKCMEKLGQTGKGHLSIGFSYPIDWTVVSRVIDKYLYNYPESDIQGMCCSRYDLYDHLLNGLIDFAISPTEIYVDGIELISTVVNIEWGLIIPSGMPQGKRPSIIASDLKHIPIILHSDSYSHNLLEQHLKTTFYKASTSYDTSSVLLSMLVDGFGAGFITSNEQEFFEHNYMKFIPLNPKLEAKFYVYSRDYSTLNTYSKYLYDSISNTTINYKELLYQT